MRTCATLFAGGGLADIGLKQAGYAPAWAVEYDPAIADVYRYNHGDHILVADVCSLDYTVLPRVDLLWASPPCPNFSVAKARRGETEHDQAIAAAVCRAIEAQQPGVFVLENVRGYQDSDSLRRIRAALDRLDYWTTMQVVNSADMGVPQTRERLILRARAGGWMQAQRPWPRPVAWRGWHEAIADLIPGLPDSAFAPWQLVRLPEEIRESVLSENAAFILDGQESSSASGLQRRDADEPVMTVAASQARRPLRAWLVEGTEMRGDITPRHDGEPVFTIKAAQHKDMPRAFLPPGRVVALTPRCLARFQGVPDAYWLPDKKSLACRVIGNGVAVAVARIAAEITQ